MIKRLILFLTIGVFLFSGVIPGIVSTIIKPPELEKNSFLSPLKKVLIAAEDLDKIAWAKDKEEKAKKKKGGGGDPLPVPEPSTLILLGTGLVGAAVLFRKKFKK